MNTSPISKTASYLGFSSGCGRDAGRYRLLQNGKERVDSFPSRNLFVRGHSSYAKGPAIIREVSVENGTSIENAELAYLYLSATRCTSLIVGSEVVAKVLQILSREFHRVRTNRITDVDFVDPVGNRIARRPVHDIGDGDSASNRIDLIGELSLPQTP